MEPMLRRTRAPAPSGVSTARTFLATLRDTEERAIGETTSAVILFDFERNRSEDIAE
jgi:hypothetical protein